MWAKTVAFMLVLVLTAGMLPVQALAEDVPSEETASAAPSSAATEPAAETEHIHGHNGEVTLAATCETAGVMTHTCPCGDVFTEEIPATGHSYVDGACQCGATEPTEPEIPVFATYTARATPQGVTTAFEGSTAKPVTGWNTLDSLTLDVHQSADVAACGDFFFTLADAVNPIVVNSKWRKIYWNDLSLSKNSVSWNLMLSDAAVERISESGIYMLSCDISYQGKSYADIAVAEFAVRVFDILTIRTSCPDEADTEVYGKVYRSNSVAVQVTEKAGYEISVFGAAGGNEAGEYIIGNLQEDAVLEIAYTKPVDSTLEIRGDYITASYSEALAPGETTDIVITPAAGYYISEIELNTGALDDAGFADGSFRASLTAGATGVSYLVAVQTAPVLTAADGQIPYNPFMELDQVFASLFACVDLTASVPDLTVADIGVQFQYLSPWGTQWLELNSENRSKFGKTYEETLSTVSVKIIYKGGQNPQYPATTFDTTEAILVDLIENRPAAPDFCTAEESKASPDGIKAAAASAATGLALTAEVFSLPADYLEIMDGLEIGETAEIAATAPFRGNADYRDGLITVYVTVTKSPLIPAKVTLSANEEMGLVTIQDRSGVPIQFDSVPATAEELTVSVVPNTAAHFENYVQSIVVTENGIEIARSAAGEDRVSFSVRNSDWFVYAYAVTVTYGRNELTGLEQADVKFNRYAGTTVAGQMAGGSDYADVLQQQTLQEEILEALEICCNGEAVLFSEAVSISYAPWYRDEETQEFHHLGNTALLAAEPESVEGQTGFAFASSRKPEKVTISYEGLSWTAEIELTEGRPELELTGGRYDTTVMIDSMEQDQSAVQAAAISVITGEKPDALPEYTYANTENLNKSAPAEILVSIRYEETAQYVDLDCAQVIVPVQVNKQPSPVTVAENEETGSGIVSICDAQGNEINASHAGVLTVTIIPADDGSYVRACKVTDQSGTEITLTGAFANACYEGSFEITSDNAYTVSVLYDKRVLTANADALAYNRFYTQVAQQADAVKAELLENVLVAGETVKAEEITVYVWSAESGAYCNIEDRSADAAFSADSVRLKILWAGSDQFPEVCLPDLELALRDSRPGLEPEAGIYDAAPLILSDNGEENVKQIREAALALITRANGESVPAPAACLYAMDVTQAEEQTAFAETFVLSKDRRVHSLAVKLIWDGTAEYTDAAAVVYLPVRYIRQENIGKLELALDPVESDTISPGAVVHLNGVPAVLDENCSAWIEPGTVEAPVLLTTYRRQQQSGGDGEYPVNMYVWYAAPADSDGDGKTDTFRTERLSQLDGFFRYEGTSIYLSSAATGIRFLTSVPKETCEKLMDGSLLTGPLAGYRMTQAGTLLRKGDPDSVVTLENGFSSDAYGQEAGKNFRVYSKTGERTLFSGVLTGIGMKAASVNADILARPYAVLEYQGQTLTIYGGQICRSVYDVAVQNQDHYPAASVYDKRIERILSIGIAAS